MFKDAKPLIRLAALVLGLAGAPFARADPVPVQYLAFQIFTGALDSLTLNQNFPPPAEALGAEVDDILRAIGTAGGMNRKLGFMVGPLALDETDDQVRQVMRAAFAIALEKNVATGFHIDDSMFWGRLASLNTPENIEWLDWNQTPSTGRRLDWSSDPHKIMPELCFNSPAVEDAVKQRAALIGEEAVRGMKLLQASGKGDLFMGVIAGWETQIGMDFATGKRTGFHALTNEGYSAEHPPADIDEARATVVREFIDLWATSLAQAGVPDDKIYAQVAFLSRTMFDSIQFGQPGKFSSSYLDTIGFTPPSTAFGPHHRPGFSTYPQFGLLEQIQAELSKNGNPPWASAEGIAGDPGAIEKGDSGSAMETYLGNLFNRGAVLVNVFGWGVGPATNPYRKIAENENAIAAYQKFLRGDQLASDPPAQIPSPQFFDKMRKLQKELPPYIAKNGPEKIETYYKVLGPDIKAQRYADAEQAIDQIFRILP